MRLVRLARSRSAAIAIRHWVRYCIGGTPAHPPNAAARDRAERGGRAAREGYRQAPQRGDFDLELVGGGESVDLISRVEPAGTLTERIGREAGALLRRLGAA